MNHPAKIITVHRNDVEVRYDVCGRVCQVPYARMIPVLDADIPRAKRRKCDQFRYMPNMDNSQQEYLHDNQQSHKQSSTEHRSILDSLSRHGRQVLNCRRRPLTQRCNEKGFNDEVVTDDYHTYHNEWLNQKGLGRGDVTTTCMDGTNTTNTSTMVLIEPRCYLPLGEWTNFMKICTAMKDFASACVPKTNFRGVDLCFFELCTCLDYGIHMDIRLANASQASLVVMFVPNADECPVMQQFIPKLYIKQIIRDEELVKQQQQKETALKMEETEKKREEEAKVNGKPLSKRKKSSVKSKKAMHETSFVDTGEDGFNVMKHKHLLMLVHAPTHFDAEEVISSMEHGFYEFEQKFEVVCAMSFSHPKSHPNMVAKEFSYFEQFGRGQFDDNRYKDCGCFKTFLTALAQLFLYQSRQQFEFVDDGELVIVPEKDSTKSYILEFLENRQIPEKSIEEVSSVTDKDTTCEVPRIFGTPSIIRKCPINDAKGNVCVSLREILHNAYECHKQCFNETRNIEPFHYNSLEFACNSDMCIYVDSNVNKFKIGCLVCNKSALSHDFVGYESIKEALTDTVKRVGLVHRIAHSAVSWLEGKNIKDHRPLGQAPYRLHLHHLSDLNVAGVDPCLPDRTKLDSCLGMDQVIVSAIENEKNNQSSCGDMVSCWADICNKFFISESVTEQLLLFEANFLHTVEHGVASAKTKFLHKMRQRDLVLMDTGDEWKSEEKLQDLHLLNNAMYMMKIDWKDSTFPREIPDDSQLSKSDRSILNKELAAKTGGIEFLHQTGILDQYLKHAPESSVCASIYRALPCVSYRYAFERGNLCKDIFTHAGRQERLHSSTMFVVKSFFNNWNEDTRQFIDSLADDESFHIVARTGYKKKRKTGGSDVIGTILGLTDDEQEPTNDIIAVEVDWVLSDELENQIHGTAHRREIEKMKHGEWHTISKKLKTEMCQYTKGVLTSYDPISFSVKSLHPYQATVMLRNMKTANDWFGTAKMQIALGNSFYHGSIHHQQAMEIMTNFSFQKPVIHQKVGVKRNISISQLSLQSMSSGIQDVLFPRQDALLESVI